MSNSVFSSKQEKVLESATRRWNILYGATRSGKTRVSYFLALKHIREHWNDKILFAGKTLNTIDRNVFDPMREIFGSRYISEIINKREIIIFGKRCYYKESLSKLGIQIINGVHPYKISRQRLRAMNRKYANFSLEKNFGIKFHYRLTRHSID